MQSTIIIGKTEEVREKKIQEILKNHEVNRFDITLIEPTTSLGIEQVRVFQKAMYLKPAYGRVKAGIVKNADTITVQAQNALLKLLEEPPNNTLILITASSKEVFLPTILSRCVIVEVTKENSFSDEDLAKYQLRLKTLQSQGTPERFALAQNLSKDKEETLLWLMNLILALRQQLINEIKTANANHYNDTYHYSEALTRSVNALQELQKTYTLIKTTNVSPRFALENLFLSL